MFSQRSNTVRGDATPARPPVAVFVTVLSAAIIGCGRGNEVYVTQQRENEGLVVILPGIEGESSLNRNIRRGLDTAGVEAAMPIYSWGRPIPLAGMVLNQIDVAGNRRAGRRIAGKIVEYKESYPGRPVYIIGHSGGGGIAVFAAEAMPDGSRIDGLVLLSASISSNYDLTEALNNCRKGIVNFHNPRDVGLLGLGTTLAGTVDGARGSSAGLEGFATPGADTPAEKRRAYRKLFQIRVPADAGSPHQASTRPEFVAGHVAPWVSGESWPVNAGRLAAGPDD